MEGAPILRPSSEEWRDPFRYIREPPFALDSSSLRLQSSTRRLSELSERDARRTRFASELRASLEAGGAGMRRQPLMGGVEIDLYTLHRLVVGEGGYHTLTAERRWGEVGAALKLKEPAQQAGALRQHYAKWLLHFELSHAESPPPHSGGEGARGEAPPPPQPLWEGMRREGSSLSLALEVLNMEESIPWEAVRQKDAQSDWGVLRSCFLELLREGGLLEGGGGVRTLSAAIGTLESILEEKALSEEWKSTHRVGWREALMRAGSVEALRGLLSCLEKHILCDFFEGEGEREEKGRRARPVHPPLPNPKRPRLLTSDKEGHEDQADREESRSQVGKEGERDLKQEAKVEIKVEGTEVKAEMEAEEGAVEEQANAAGVAPSESKPNVSGMSVCSEEEGRGEEREEIVARRTRNAMMQESLMARGVSSNGGRRDDSDDDDDEAAHASHEEEELTSLDGFQQRAVRYKNSFFGGSKGTKKNTKPGLVTPDVEVPPERVEREFWRLVGGGEKSERARQFDLCYSASALSCGAGGGFPRADEPGAELEEPYTSSPWNLNNIPTHPDCVLTHLGPQAQSMPTTLEFGMLFSCSGWSTHRHFLHSLSYLHSGAPRSWYGLSGHDLAAVEDCMHEQVSGGEFTLDEGRLRLPSLLSLSALGGHHVHVARLVQQPREFVLTMPAAFTCTLDHGFNCSESVPFAPIEWLPWGRRAARMHEQLQCPPLFSMDALVLRASKADETIRGAVCLHVQLEEMATRHDEALAALSAGGAALEENDAGTPPPPPPLCSVCRQPCVLGLVNCECGVESCCFCHVSKCGCPPSSKRVSLPIPRGSLSALLSSLSTRLALREEWLEQAEAALRSSPSLGEVGHLLLRASKMGLDHPLCNSLARLSEEGTAWQARADTLIASRSTHAPEHVEALLAEAKRLSLSLPSATELEATLLSAREWQERADVLLSRGRGTGGEWVCERAAERAELSELLASPEASLLLLPQAGEVRAELRRIALAEGVERMLGEVPSLEEAKGTIEEAGGLGMDHLPPVVELSRRCAAGAKWAQRANIALRRRTGLASLEALLGEAEGLGVALLQKEEVEGRIRSAREWSERAREAMAARAGVEAVRLLAEEAALLDVTVAEEEAISRMLKAAEWWTKRASSALLKRGCSVSLLGLLRAAPSDLLDEAAPGSSSSGSAGLACLYCTGNDTATLNRFMIGCDACGRWYHGPCVGVGKGAADSMEDYLCPLCSEAKGVEYVFPPTPVPKYTRRPRLKNISSLLAEAGDIGIEMEEVGLISALHSQAEEWQARASELLEAEGEMEASVVEAMVREGEGCEVEPDALLSLRKLRTALMQWQQGAKAVLGGRMDVDAPLTEEEAEAESQMDEELWLEEDMAEEGEERREEAKEGIVVDGQGKGEEGEHMAIEGRHEEVGGMGQEGRVVEREGNEGEVRDAEVDGEAKEERREAQAESLLEDGGKRESPRANGT
ncbi:MAG: hypothetical protein SGPRY_005400, partial [Prymnesium sp.]